MSNRKHQITAKSVVPVLALAIGCVCVAAGWSKAYQDDEKEKPPTGLAFTMEALEKQRAENGNAYLPFLNRSTLHCGVYHLAAGAKDGQSPHSQDEVYYVQSGKGKLQVDGEDFDASPGAVLFVAANAKHHFHSIEEDLTLLVFFSKAVVKD